MAASSSSSPITTFQMTADVAGVATLASPIPPIASIAGFEVSLQGFWYWPQQCTGPTLNFSSTQGLDLVIQP